MCQDFNSPKGTATEYKPKHLKRPEGQLSEYAREKLIELGSYDPWSGPGINRAVSQYQALWAEVRDDGRTPEDVVNYLSSEIVAMIVVAADMTGPVQDYMECLTELVYNLCGVENG